MGALFARARSPSTSVVPIPSATLRCPLLEAVTRKESHGPEWASGNLCLILRYLFPAIVQPSSIGSDQDLVQGFSAALAREFNNDRKRCCKTHECRLANGPEDCAWSRGDHPVFS